MAAQPVIPSITTEQACERGYHGDRSCPGAVPGGREVLPLAGTNQRGRGLRPGVKILFVERGVGVHRGLS